MAMPILVIGNKNYSSWSLRPWLCLRKAGVEFTEQCLALDTARFEEEIATYSPTRRVPVLWDGSRCVWDSLAIAEYINERWANNTLWPLALPERAWARSVSAEMHAGFACLRESMPMNCRARDRRVTEHKTLQIDIDRVLDIWHECRQQLRGSGDWLFGPFSIADAMFAPMALRFNTYGVELPESARHYVETTLSDPDIGDWIAAAAAESDVIEQAEVGLG